MASEDRFIPPPEVAAEAGKGIELRRLHRYNARPEVTALAKALSLRQPMDFASIQKIGAYFASHHKNKKNWDNEIRPPAARVQWQLRGGDAGNAWVKQVLSGAISGDRPNLPTLTDALARRMTALELPSDISAFIGNVEASAQTNILLYGVSGQGKSTLALRLAAIFSRFGNVLYVAAEEKLNAGTIKTRAQYLGVNSDAVYFLETVKYSEILKYLDANHGKFRWVFIDSKDMLDERDIITLQILDRYPNLNFIAVAQVNKQRRSAGREAWPHKVDVVIRCYRDDEGARWAVNEKNRLGATQESLFLFKPEKLSSSEDESKNAPPRSYAAWIARRMNQQIANKSRLQLEDRKHKYRMLESEHKLRLKAELSPSSEGEKDKATTVVRYKKNGAEETEVVEVE